MSRFFVPYAISILLLSLIITGCTEPQKQEAPPLRPVKAIVAGALTASKQWSFSGTAEDALESGLSFRVNGKIIKFPGDKIGKKFSAGETIAKLDPLDYELQMSQARASSEQVRASFIRAKSDVKRVRQLFEKRVISRSELDQAEAEFQSFQAQLNASTKKLDIARKQLGYTTLKAPFDGQVGKVNAQIHQNVQSGQSIVSFSAGKQMKMYISIPDTLISQINVGDKVKVSFDALPSKVFDGAITEISIATTQGSSFPVKIHITNPSHTIRSGMTGRVQFANQDVKEQIFVPSEAICSDVSEQRTVWIVDPKTMTVKSRTIELGPVTHYGIAIKSGVAVDEIIVTRGVHHLKNGMQVRLPKDMKYPMKAEQ